MFIFLAGLFLFLLGLEGCKISLGKFTTSKIKQLLKSISENIYLCIIIGAAITAILQSSSAVSVIVIGLIEAKLLEFKPAVGIILGANIGTTITVQILAFPIAKLIPFLFLFSIIFIFIGLFFNDDYFFVGLTFISFGIVFTGLNMMTIYFQNPAGINLISKILAFSGKNTFLGILLGLIVTGIIQSSSVVTGITVSLAKSSLISLPVAVAIALGSNIGTCITAFIASINCKRLSRSLAWGHFLFNIVGVLTIIPLFNIFIYFVTLSSNNLLRQIANAHTLFNIYNVIIFLPVIDTFVSFLERGNFYGYD